MRPLDPRSVRWSPGDARVSRGRPRKSGQGPKDRMPLVLIIDDDALLREAVEFTLRGLCETVGLSSGADLEEFIGNASPDLLILDVTLPGRDGFELCRALRADKRWRSLPILFLTGRRGEVAFDHFLSVQGDAFLTKPFESDELVETVIRLLPPEEPD